MLIENHGCDVADSVSTLYRQTFNVSIGIIELNVVNETCPTTAPAATPWNSACSSSITLNDRLSSFSSWRGRSGTRNAGLYYLATACATNQEVGVAWLGTLCQTGSTTQGSGTVSGTGVSVAMRAEWVTIAHEISHIFGGIHDCRSGCSLSSACCPSSSTSCDAGQQFIMNPSTNSGSPQTQFSPCTVGNVCSLIGNRGIDTSCIVSPGGQTVLSLQSCGNGIVDAGEVRLGCDEEKASDDADSFGYRIAILDRIRHHHAVMRRVSAFLESLLAGSQGR